MRFRDLAEAFAELEATSSRRRMIELVASLLGRVGRADREAAVYLLQGAVRPPYEGVETGTGERLLVAAIARAFRHTAAAVARRLARAGDAGLVAEALAGAPRGRGMTVGQAYRVLLEVARTSGEGSVDRKVALLATALRSMGPLEARYLVRAAEGRLRLGVGDQTILEAAALAALGSRDERELLERAYNVRSDLALVVVLAFTRGRRGLRGLGPEPGIPVRPALAQRMPSAAAIIGRLGRVQAEPKYDGFRLQVHRDGGRIRVFSRRLEDVTGMFPELADAVRHQLRATRAILEGEAIGFEPDTGRFLPFQLTLTRKRKHGVSRAATERPLRLFAFDLLLAGRRNQLPLPQRERTARLRKLVRGGAGDTLAVTEAIETDRPAELERYFRDMLRRGLEGIIAKRPDAPYQAGVRGFDWVKLKRAYQSRLRDTVDLVIVGYLRGRGKRTALGIGSLLTAVYDPEGDRFRTVAKIGSGLPEDAWRMLRARLDRSATTAKPRRVDSLITPDVWVEPRIVVEVLADEITRSPRHTCGRRGGEPGYALRFPRLVGGIRSDKAPADATSEAEVLELHRLQRAGRSPARTRAGLPRKPHGRLAPR